MRRSNPYRWLRGARGLAVVVALFVALTASCQDNEQRARGMGAEARDAVARACADGGDGDAGIACVDERCRAACGKSKVPTGFDVPCLDACRQTAICATSADCGTDKECVAIAPVVRKCVAKVKAAP